MVSEGALSLSRCCHRIGGAGKRHEEAVALGVHFVAVVGHPGGAQQGSLIGQNVGVTGSKLLKQACRTLDIGEEERDRPGWKI